jgi:uncharacterized protein (DUF1499 family)
MLFVKWFLLALLVVASAAVLIGQLGFLRGQAPGDLGVRNGRLKPPSNTPNSVTSQAKLYPDHPLRAYADIAPLPVQGGDGAASMARLKKVVEAMDGARVVTSEADYLYAQFTTPWMK